ncbi:Abi family protein [Salinibacterium sp. SWN248]|uniref:Abi family protein n=1 Tax=Salinibacterium sp. SWN248 TaxID=2792056 RepID=UPI0018CF5426|nr:Abi family protein [Salinibacterium sp. SWN248]MBH0023034.1 Abi family protein [Salinibacterium sp. SWN248]
MLVEDDGAALALLQRAGYYTLSGYSHTFRLKAADGSRSERFREGTTFESIHALWAFDNRLRAATFASLQTVETHLRALIGYSLGAVDPLIHMKPALLSISRTKDYRVWSAKLKAKVEDSREDFVIHHRDNRENVIPVWVAVDVLDWGGLSYLYSFMPLRERETVAAHFDLSAAQLLSWLRSLNTARNVCAHHSRFFNRHYAISPKLTRLGENPALDEIAASKQSTFGMLSLVQHLSSKTQGHNKRLLPAALSSFPLDSGLNFGALGTTEHWRTFQLWR